ncbi:MAG: DNA mismatch repair protein MutS [Phycisphaerae bacterium]
MSSESPTQTNTPAMRQYRAFKEKYPDYVLFFRMGDFYELFYEDAKIGSRELGLALTSRSKGPSAVPLAGIPYHAMESYLARLVKAGYRVAICEQVEDPAEAKGVVKRDVTRLVTPGTLTDEVLLDQKEGNFLACIFDPRPPQARHTAVGEAPDHDDDHAVGLAWVELSSGTFQTTTVPSGHAFDELLRLRPAEVIFPEGSRQDTKDFRRQLAQLGGAGATSRPPWSFEADSAKQTLQEHFQAATLEGFGFDGWDGSLSAAGAIIEYLRETQKTALAHIRSLRRFDRSDHMAMDANTLRCLEVHRTLRTNRREGSLLACIDETSTGMGARRLEHWLTFPLKRYSHIVARHDAVQELSEDRDRLERIRRDLSDVAQIDRITANIAMNRVRPRELVALGQALRILPELYAALEGVGADLLVKLRPAMNGLDEPAELISRAIDPDCPNVLREGGVIADGFDEELDRLRRISTDGQSWLAGYQHQQIKRTGIDNLKIGYNKVFGYYIEVTNANADKVPADFVRKQTLKNAERYITDELKRYESEVLTAAERARSLEADLFEKVRAELSAYIADFQAAADAVASLDALCSLAQLAVARGWRRPEVTQDNVLRIVAGRHPVLAEQLREQFVPNDVSMGAEKDRLLVITGPNMSGKSTYIRQVALLVLLAQAGSFIPADEATIGLTDRIFTRVGASDELQRGMSTFMLEMVETANILNNATARSLVILDEVGRGTSTYDGLALAWAISEHIATHIRCRTLFATHYHELTELENLLPAARNLNVAVREWADEVIFLHRIIEGGTDKSYGVHVARLAGVPREVLDRAKAILPQLQAHLAEGLDVPSLSESARRAAEQMELFADPATRVVRELKSADLENMTPLQAMELLRKLKEQL